MRVSLISRSDTVVGFCDENENENVEAGALASLTHPEGICCHELLLLLD